MPLHRCIDSRLDMYNLASLSPTVLTVALMLQCCDRLSSVCDVCIAAKRCVLSKNCLKKKIENGLWGIEWSHDS